MIEYEKTKTMNRISITKKITKQKKTNKVTLLKVFSISIYGATNQTQLKELELI